MMKDLFYIRLANLPKHHIELVNEEQKHKHLIEKKIAEVMRG